MIDAERAREIAEEDARTKYCDLTIYRVEVTREGDAWRVDYEVSDARIQGGGPHYLIDDGGRIVKRRYEQ